MHTYTYAFTAQACHTARISGALAGRPVLDIEFRHREIGNVRRGQRRGDPDGRGCDQAVSLMEGDPALGELTTPAACTLRFGGAERHQPESPNQATSGRFLLRPKTTPDLLDRDGRYPRLDTDASESLDATGGGPSSERVDQHRRVEQQPGHAQPTRRGSPLRCARTQLAGPSSQSWPVSEMVPNDASISSQRRSSSRPRRINAAMKALRRLGPARRSRSATSSSSRCMCNRMCSSLHTSTDPRLLRRLPARRPRERPDQPKVVPCTVARHGVR